MSIRHTVRRVPWPRIEQELLPAFEQAREQASLEPLRDFVEVERLEPSRHIITGKKYLLFGVEQRDLFNIRPLLVEAIDALALETLDLGSSGAALADTLRESGTYPQWSALWQSVLNWDHGLPQWMVGEEGPSVVSPGEVAQLRESFSAIFELERVAEQSALRAELERLRELIARCERDQGLALSCRVTDGSSPVTLR